MDGAVVQTNQGPPPRHVPNTTPVQPARLWNPLCTPPVSLAKSIAWAAAPGTEGYDTQKLMVFTSSESGMPVTPAVTMSLTVPSKSNANPIFPVTWSAAVMAVPLSPWFALEVESHTSFVPEQVTEGSSFKCQTPL